jgi:pyruvate, water dikinase
VKEGRSVLSEQQRCELGVALRSIHDYFAPAYGPEGGNAGLYAMDVEFKFDDDRTGSPTLYVKQARPAPELGQWQ